MYVIWFECIRNSININIANQCLKLSKEHLLPMIAALFFFLEL